MGCVVPIRFSPAFFGIVSERKVDDTIFVRIDRQWWTSVNCKEHMLGLSFESTGSSETTIDEGTARIAITDMSYAD
jgi:hypothetical protein